MNLENLILAGNYEAVSELIRSEQIPPYRVAEILADYPDFAEWIS